MKKKIVGLVSVVVVIVISICVFFAIRKPYDVKAEIKNNFELMAKESLNETISPELAASSNPYDYIDSEYYDRIIEMGTDAMEPLEELMYSGEISGPYAYVSAIALQDITGCNIHNITGNSWSNVEEFKILWDVTMGDLPEVLEGIQNDKDITAEEKVNETEKYGIFGKVYANKTAKMDFEMGDKKIKSASDAELKKLYKRCGEGVNSRDVDNVLKYMDSKCK